METKMNYNLDALARDVAMEINLGGFRLDPDDLADVLSGISRSDLDIFRSRVRYHSVDFAPAGREDDAHYLAWLEKSIDGFLSGVKPKDNSESKGPGWFEGEKLYEDRGKYFLLMTGVIERCEKASRYAMWGTSAADSLKPVEVPSAKVNESLASLLLKRYGDGKDLVSFMTESETPEGRIVGIYAVKDKAYLSLAVSPDGEAAPKMKNIPVSSLDVEDGFGKCVYECFVQEMDVRRQADAAERLDTDSLRSEISSICHDLIDLHGYRVQADSLYDRFELEGDADGKYRYFIDRKVDDLADSEKLPLYLVYTPESGNGLSRTAFGSLDRKELDNLYRRIKKMRMLSLNGRFGMSVPLYAPVRVELFEGSTVMATRVASENGKLSVIGKSEKTLRTVAVPLNMLKPGSVDRLCKATESMLDATRPKIESLERTRAALKAELDRKVSRPSSVVAKKGM